jgi:hypothetical protein
MSESTATPAARAVDGAIASIGQVTELFEIDENHKFVLLGGFCVITKYGI